MLGEFADERLGHRRLCGDGRLLLGGELGSRPEDDDFGALASGGVARRNESGLLLHERNFLIRVVWMYNNTIK